MWAIRTVSSLEVVATFGTMRAPVIATMASIRSVIAPLVTLPNVVLGRRRRFADRLSNNTRDVDARDPSGNQQCRNYS
jgi:hypothetical protein